MIPYYDKNGITIYCGNCLEVMPQLNQTFDAIIADLPYGTTACSWDSMIPLEPLWVEYKRLIDENRAIVTFADEPFTSVLISSNFKWFKYRWVWKKTVAANFMNAKLRPLQRHEDIVIFSSGTTANGSSSNMIYNPQGIQKTNLEWKRPAKYPSDHNFVRPSHKLQRIIEYSNYPDSILEFPNGNNNRLHPTQKPVDLIRYLIRTYTNKDEIILDNTMGSGTTLIAAKDEGRRAVGIEISEEYCEIAVERLKETINVRLF